MNDLLLKANRITSMDIFLLFYRSRPPEVILVKLVILALAHSKFFWKNDYLFKLLRGKTNLKFRLHDLIYLTLSWRRSLSYRNHSIDLLFKSVDWFLYERDLRHEKVNASFTSPCTLLLVPETCYEALFEDSNNIFGTAKTLKPSVGYVRLF